MDKVQQQGKFKPKGKTKHKSQIVLCHSSREAEEYLASLQFRYNGRFDRIPNYFITKSGEVFQFLPENTYSKFFNDEKVNEKSIFIVLENLGWLEKKPLSNSYINWKGSIYNDKVYEKKWRDYFFWDPYPDQQVDILSQLCLELCEVMNIEKKCSGHNTKIDGIKNFEGIVSRSNYDSRFTDLNPSFNFEKLLKTKL
jgi:N-acetyl-anhydromuramyl-L-alanine amidase AmpD